MTAKFAMQSYVLNQYRQTENEQRTYLSKTISDTQQYIIENNLTLTDVLEKGLIYSIEDYEVCILDKNGKIINAEDRDVEFDYVFLSGLPIYPIDFSDQSGFLCFQPKIDRMIFHVYEVSVVIFIMFIFGILMFLMLRKQFLYIKKIDDGIEVLAGGELKYEIPVVGNNELAHLALSINEMSKSLQTQINLQKEMDRKQRQMITNISHDLRTPLTVIIGYLNILESNKYKTEEEADNYLKSVLNKSLHLQALVEDLFTYTKLCNSEMKVSMTDINIHTLLMQYLETQDINVQYTADNSNCKVRLDIDLFMRVMDNLFSNIRKYAVLDKPITLILNTKNGIAQIILENETKQNLDEKIESIFDRTVIGDSSRKNKTSGIGLSIVFEIVKLMYGRIYAEFASPRFKIVMSFPIVENS